ncbi:flagellar basal body P-ring formation chaperone FlgA [Alphaproteobacteria bacterium]|nr:flagellar basal body P-ring formation chaperone FlgA [Alphaproteobacteria bacterium]
MDKILLRFLLSSIIFIICSSKSMSMTGKEISDHLSQWLINKGIEGQPIFSKHKKFKNCEGKIKVNKIFEDYNTLRIICPDTGGFNLAIRVVLKEASNKVQKINTPKKVYKKKKYKFKSQTKKVFQVISLNKTMEKNSVLTINDLETLSLSNLGKSSFFNDKNMLIGRKIKKNLKMGQILHPRHVFENFEIESGDALSIVSSVGKAYVIVGGEAQNAGNLGDLIRVKNLRSGKIVKGYIKKNKIIRVFR